MYIKAKCRLMGRLRGGLQETIVQKWINLSVVLRPSWSRGEINTPQLFASINRQREVRCEEDKRSDGTQELEVSEEVQTVSEEARRAEVNRVKGCTRRIMRGEQQDQVYGFR